MNMPLNSRDKFDSRLPVGQQRWRGKVSEFDVRSNRFVSEVSQNYKGQCIVDLMYRSRFFRGWTS